MLPDVLLVLTVTEIIPQWSLCFPALCLIVASESPAAFKAYCLQMVMHYVALMC